MPLTFLHLFQYVDLRTRYSELMTLTSQYIKFITETQRRLEDDEVITHKLLRNRPKNKLTPTNTAAPPPPTCLLMDVWEIICHQIEIKMLALKMCYCI